LGRIEIDGRMFIVASYGGAEVNPAWVHNLRVHPKARIETGAETLDVVARELPSDERNAVWARIVDAAPAFAQYQSRTTRTITVFELTRT
jgi:deazaflavin-dependent oxidoreductase (nitroreductase family)